MLVLLLFHYVKKQSELLSFCFVCRFVSCCLVAVSPRKDTE